MEEGSLLGGPGADYGKWLERDYVQGQRNAALAGKVRGQQKEKDDSRVQKYIHDFELESGKVHRLYSDDTRQTGAKLMSDIDALKDKYGEHNYMNYVPELAQKAYDHVAENVRLSKPWIEDGKRAQAHPEEYTAPQQEALRLADVGSLDDIKKLGNDPMGSFSVNDKGEANFGKRLPKGFDIDKHTAAFLQQIGKQNRSQITGETVIPGTNGKISVETESFLPETIEDAKEASAKVSAEIGHPVTFTSKEQALKDHFKDTGQVQAVFGENNRDKYTGSSGLDFKDPDKKWKSTMAEDYYQQYKGLGGSSFKRTVVAPVKQATGYNRGTGSAVGDRFASEKTSDGGVLSPISVTEKLPIVHIQSKYALKGDATETGSKSLAADFGDAQDVSFQGWKKLSNPLTGKKQMFFVVNKPSSATGSESQKGGADKSGAQSSSSTKDLSPDQTWLIPADAHQQKKFFTYTANKNGNNPHKQSFLDDIRSMESENAKVKSKEESTFDPGPVTKPAKKTKSDPMGLGL